MDGLIDGLISCTLMMTFCRMGGRIGTGVDWREKERDRDREKERERPKEGKAEPMMRVVSETNGLVSCRLAVSCQILHLSRE